MTESAKAQTRLDAESSDSTAPDPASPSPAHSLTEDAALAWLQHRDCSAEEIENITSHSDLMKSRKVRLAVAAHLNTPRRLALRLLREFFTFDLVRFALLPTGAPDLKRIADELLIGRLPSITFGERISLARRCSVTVASALLADKEQRVWQAALENPRMTESGVVRALQKSQATVAFVEAVCRHAKWSVRPEVRMALLRSPHTPLARALEFARSLPAAHVRDLLHNSPLPHRIKEYLKKDLESRG